MEDEAPEEHVRLKNELLYLAQKQRLRIDKLKVDAEVQLESYADAKRKELQTRKTGLQQTLRELTPRLDEARREWQRYKLVNSEYEARHKKLSEQYRATQARLKVLHEAISGAHQGSGEGRDSVHAIRGHLEEVEKDKSELRKKIQRSLDCIVIDENMLQSRLDQEVEYAAQVRQMLASVEREVAGADEVDVAQQYLNEDARLVSEHLTEMKQKTNDLHDTFAVARRTKHDVMEEFLRKAGETTRDLHRQNAMLDINSQAVAFLERQADHLGGRFVEKDQQSAAATASLSTAAALRQKLEVLDGLLAEVGHIKEKYQVKGEDRQVLKESTGHCSKTKAELSTIEARVEGKDKYRRKLVDEIVDMRHLLDEKLQEEDTLVDQLEALLLELGEDVRHVRDIVEKHGFDDYVSSDSEPDEDVFVKLDEEGTADVEAITTSLDFAPGDPAGSDALQRFGNRQQGGLRSFAEARAAQLARRHPADFSSRLPRARSRDSGVEAMLMQKQQQAVEEVASAIRARKEAIEAGVYDSRMNVVIPDPEQTNRNAAAQQQVEEWKEQHRGGARYRLDKDQRSSSVPVQKHPQASSDASLVVGEQQDIVAQYLQRMLQGFAANMFFNGPAGPFLRRFFMSKDLRSLVWRPEEPGVQDDQSVPIADIRTVVTGHHTGVFQQHKEHGQVPMRDSTALSVVLLRQASIDIEFESPDERDYWSQILNTVISEMKPGGTINVVINSGVLRVRDYSQPEQRFNGEPYDRSQVVVEKVRHPVEQ